MRLTPLLIAALLLAGSLAVLGWVLWRAPEGSWGVGALICGSAALVFAVVSVRRQQEQLAEVERALARSQVRALALIEASPDGVMVVRDGRVAFINPALRALLAIRAEEELTGRSFTGFFAVADRESIETWIRRRQTGEAVAAQRELRGLSASGVEIPLWASTALLPAEHGGRQVALFLRDLTARNLLQGRLAQVARLEAIAGAGLDLVREIEQMFRRIRGLTFGSGDEQTAPHEEPLLSIERTAARGVALVRRAQALAPAPGEGVAHEPLDLSRLVREVAADFLRSLPPPSTLHFQPAPEAVVAVNGSAAGLRQALWNLLQNAREAQPAGAVIELSLRIEAGSEDEPVPGFGAARHAVIEVRDHGAGLSDEVQRRAFAPFFTTKGPHAAGLGLTVAYGTARSHGGVLELHPAADGGAVARLLLPLGRALPGTAVGPRDPRERWRGRESILIVDDDTDHSDAWRRGLEGFGYHVERAGSPGDALERLRLRPAVDLVLLDMVLPGRNGPEVLERILHHWPGQRVLMIASYPLPEQELEVRRIGALGSIRSQLSGDELARACREALDQPPPAAA